MLLTVLTGEVSYHSCVSLVRLVVTHGSHWGGELMFTCLTGEVSYHSCVSLVRLVVTHGSHWGGELFVTHVSQTRTPQGAPYITRVGQKRP